MDENTGMATLEPIPVADAATRGDHSSYWLTINSVVLFERVKVMNAIALNRSTCVLGVIPL